MPAPDLRTTRLLLRHWRPSDLEPFAALNADPVVMEHFPGTLPRKQSDELARRIGTRLSMHEYGLWALEIPARAPFIGFAGLAASDFEAHFTPAIEIGWRLARPHWGHGYTPEAARVCLEYAFRELELDQVVSFTTLANRNSRRVMEKLGMTHDRADDFDHPNLPAGSPARRHALYRLSRERWLDRM